MPDYIPAPDADFDNWVSNYTTYVNTNFAALGLTMTQNTALQNKMVNWSTDYFAHVTEQATASSVQEQKDITRDELEDIVREYTASMQANPTVTDAQKAALGITIPKTTRTPSPVPITRPIANVDNRQRLQHIISFFDEGTPTSKAKPLGVRACEIWVKIGGPPPTGPNEVTFVAADTRTPYTLVFDDADAGKTAHYMLRWLNTRNEPGPWSETLSFTISG